MKVAKINVTFLVALCLGFVTSSVVNYSIPNIQKEGKNRPTTIYPYEVSKEQSDSYEDYFIASSDASPTTTMTTILAVADEPEMECKIGPYAYLDSRTIRCINSIANITTYKKTLNQYLYSSVRVLFQFTTLEKIERGMFDDVRITTLLLSNIRLHSIEDGAFSKLKRLHTLEMHNDNLITLTSSTFQGLVSLQYLQLNYNLIEKISSEMFDYLPLIRNCLYANPIQTMEYKGPKPCIHYPSSYEGSKCSRQIPVDLTILRKNTFRDSIDNVKHLILENNGIQVIEKSAFYGLTILQNLTINLQNISNIGTDTFDGLNKLTLLDLSNNNISVIQPGAFEGLFSLKKLILNNNNIKRIQRRMFEGLYDLTELDFDFDDSITLEAGSFIGLKSLQKLNIKGLKSNTLFSNIFEGLESVRVLDLGESFNISSIEPDAFFGMSGLKVLRLNDMFLRTLKKNSFSGLENLEELHITFSQIQFIEQNTFNGLNNLRKLNLAFNEITSLDIRVFLGMSNLKYLDLKLNYIVQLNTMDSNVTSLEMLSLSHNEIESKDLEQFTFQNFPNLVTLDLHSNYISYLNNSNVFKGLTNLKNLDLSQNFITEINPDVMRPLCDLETLNVTANILENIKIERLLEYSPRLNRIALNGNQWQCKNLYDLLNILKKENIEFDFNTNNNQFINTMGISCNSDNDPSNIILGQTDTDTDQSDTYFYMIISILVVVVVVLIIIFYVQKYPRYKSVDVNFITKYFKRNLNDNRHNFSEHSEELL